MKAILIFVGIFNSVFIYAVILKYCLRRHRNSLYPKDSGMEAVIWVQIIFAILFVCSLLFM